MGMVMNGDERWHGRFSSKIRLSGCRMQDVIDVIDVMQPAKQAGVQWRSMCLKLGARSFGGPGYAERMSSVC